MEYIDVLRFFGFTKKQDLFNVLLHRESEIRYEVSEKTAISAFVPKRLEISELSYSNQFGFTLSYPVSPDLRVFQEEKKRAQIYDFSFLLDDLNVFSRTQNSRIFLASIKYENNKIMYNFFVFDFSRKTDDLCKLLF